MIGPPAPKTQLAHDKRTTNQTHKPQIGRPNEIISGAVYGSKGESPLEKYRRLRVAQQERLLLWLPSENISIRQCRESVVKIRWCARRLEDENVTASGSGLTTERGTKKTTSRM